MMDTDDESAAMAYASALTDWGDAGGYRAEVLWDACCAAALGVPYERCHGREVVTLSGGEQKRLVLEALLRGPDEVLLLDEPDNYLEVTGKRWLEEQLAATTKTVLLVSHDRELLANTAERIITVESGAPGCTEAGSPAMRRHGVTGSTGSMSCVADGTRSTPSSRRLLRQCGRKRPTTPTWRRGCMPRRHDYASSRRRDRPRSLPREQNVRMRLRGGRTGKRAVICEQLELTGLMMPFDCEIWYGERVAVLGSNGSGKTHFLRLLAGDDVPHSGTARLGARVLPGLFAQTHARPDLAGRSLVELLATEHALLTNEAMSALARYELQDCARQPFGTLSGGQQARLQILLLELAGSTLLLLDEPTDNLDLASAEALQQGLESYQGTVVAVTHDRWFARSLIVSSFSAATRPSTRRMNRCGKSRGWPVRAEVSGRSGRDPVPGLLGCRQSNEPAPAPSGYAPQMSRWRDPQGEKVARARAGRCRRVRCLEEGSVRPCRAGPVVRSHNG